MIILFFLFLLTEQQMDVEFDDNYFWTSIEKNQDNNIYRIKDLKQPYYYVQVILFHEDLSFFLMYDLNQIATLNTSLGDYVRRTRFLKIEPNGEIIYITAYSNSTSGFYNITIWGSEEEYCDNNCSYKGECTDDGCECDSGYVGTDCHQAALEIQDGSTQLNLFKDEIQLIYFNIDDYKEMDIQLSLSTDSHQGIEIIIELTEAIIIPSQTQFDNKSKFIKQYKIYDSQPLDLILTNSISQKLDNIQIVFAVRQINSHLNTLVSTLIINLLTYNKFENTVSIIVIIIIVISISAAVIIIIILFFVCKNIRRRKILRQQARLRMVRQGDQSANQLNDQKNLFDFLTPVQIDEQNNQDNCAICLCNLNGNQEVRQTCCHHNFHSLCIKEWFSKNKKECPICRTNLYIKEPYQIPNQ